MGNPQQCTIATPCTLTVPECDPSRYSSLPIVSLASSGLRDGSFSSIPSRKDGDLFGTCKDWCKLDCESCEDVGSLFVQRGGNEVVLEV